MLLAMGCYTNMLVKVSFKALPDTLLKFQPFDFQKAASGSFIAIIIINHTAEILTMVNPYPGEDLFYYFVHVLLCGQLQLNNVPGDFNLISQPFRNADVHRNITAQ